MYFMALNQGSKLSSCFNSHKINTFSSLFLLPLLGNFANLGKDGISIKIFQCVKDAHCLPCSSFTFDGDLRIFRPFTDRCLGNTGRHQPLTKGIIFHGRAEPIGTFGQRLEGTCRCMDAVITRVGFAFQTKILILVKDRTSDRSLWCRSRVGCTEDVTTEIFPAQGIGWPRNGVPVDLLTRAAVGYLFIYFIFNFQPTQPPNVKNESRERSQKQIIYIDEEKTRYITKETERDDKRKMRN